MPEISRFLGIVITMYFRDHSPPHFHARYGREEAKFSIETLEVLKGELSRRVTSLIREWANEHRSELMENWNAMLEEKPFTKIDPLL